MKIVARIIGVLGVGAGVLGLGAAITLANAGEPDLGRIADPAVWRVVNRLAKLEGDVVRLDARDNDGVAWIVGSDFQEGTIDVDVRGSNTPARSFVGIAFRGLNDTAYDAVYFRPFNFKNPDIPRRARAVQYVSMPQFPWEKLRADSPGKYEAAVTPVPDPDGWFHARIVVENRKVSVFVDEAKTPSLEVAELTDRRGGLLGLWVGNASAGDFARLKITSKAASSR